MSASTVYYFVDSNLFLQCRPLEQLDWTPWNAFEEVRLIVSSPVLREIDYRKNKGSDRVGTRARATSAMFREMLQEGHKVVRASSPRVVLSIEPQHTYSRDLEERLNYQARDDQLVGTVHEFSRGHRDRDVRLLTHDTTPLYMAHGLDLAADQISDDWLLPPETTAAEKELASLKTEYARLKKTEPSISIRCMDPSDSEVERYHASYTSFEPLTDQQVGELMQRLKDHFPLETDFGSREPAERAVKQTGLNVLLGTKEVFTPATDEEIAEYRDEAYPQWLLACEDVLRNHHRTLQREVPLLEFSFLAANVGTRPATDALLTIEARGRFWIRPPPPEDDDEEQDGKEHDLESAKPDVLPRPPVAPCGQWQRWVGGHPTDAGRALQALARSLQGIPGLTDRRRGILDYPLLHTPIVRHPSHDSNAFYYKPNRPTAPGSSFSLECDQWRHDEAEEPFDGEIQVPTDQDEVKGALLCRIQAANLSNSAPKLVPVRIDIAHISAFDSARAMLESLLTTPKFRIRPQPPDDGEAGNSST